MKRVLASWVVKEPSGRSSQFNETLGSSENWGVTSIRPRLSDTAVLSPLQKPPVRKVIWPLAGRWAPNRYDTRKFRKSYPPTGIVTPGEMVNGLVSSS